MQFVSDNQAGASKQVLKMLDDANTGFTNGYGDDQWCLQTTVALKILFGC